MKHNLPTVSLIIATYNWTEALQLCLMSVLNQSVLPTEVIIADDGSTDDTKHLIDNMRNQFSCPLIHVWHEDLGFRLTVIRNRAIVKASSDYILQIDGDIILNKHFIEDHLLMASSGCFATGSRASLTQELTAKLFQKKQIHISLFSKGLKNKQNAFRNSILSNYYRFRYKKDSPYYIKGCNMAFWRKDLIAVNGYNEDMTGWGYEDNELAARLINYGIKKQFLKFRGIVYHLYHTTNSKERETINSGIMDAAVKNNITYCKNGLDKYLEL